MSKIKRNSKDGPEDTTFYKLKIKDLEKEISSLKQVIFYILVKSSFQTYFFF